VLFTVFWWLSNVYPNSELFLMFIPVPVKAQNIFFSLIGLEFIFKGYGAIQFLVMA